MKYAIAIDIGGTNTRVALINDEFVIKDRIQFPTNINAPYETLNKIKEIILSYQEEVIGIGMSCPGPLDLLTGTIKQPPNLNEQWHNLAIANVLQQLVNLPVYLDNDANLAALGEATIGEGKDYRYVQFLTISTGLGAGLVIDKKIFLGSHGYANEVANSVLMKDGPSHGSIYPGGIEAICSGTAITTRAIKAGLNVLHAGEVYQLAIDGNEIALKIYNEAKLYLANYIAIIQGYIDPDIVILGGSVALKIPNFVEEVEQLVKQRVYDVVKPFVKVRRSSLDEDSGLIGAAYLAFNKK